MKRLSRLLLALLLLLLVAGFIGTFVFMKYALAESTPLTSSLGYGVLALFSFVGYVAPMYILTRGM
jgi:hypothetical protein